MWERVKDHMPRPVDHYHGPCAQPVGLNQRWRLYRYGVDDIFRMHTDGAWPGSALDASGHSIVRDAYGDRWSQLTFLLYLDDDYDGGETTFFVPSEEMPGTGSLVSVSVPKGLCSHSTMANTSCRHCTRIAGHARCQADNTIRCPLHAAWCASVRYGHVIGAGAAGVHCAARRPCE